MSRAIRSYPKEERKSVINRRLAQPEEKQGLGYWAARDATKGEKGKCTQSTNFAPPLENGTLE